MDVLHPSPSTDETADMLHLPHGGAPLENFILVGGVRAGTSAVQSALDNHSQAACHANLFHECCEVRQQAHEAYYGPPVCPKNPEHFDGIDVNPNKYLRHQVFPIGLRGETHVGVRLYYNALERWELFDLFDELSRTLRVIHVVRNPVACYISHRQAEASQIYCRSYKDEARFPPGVVNIDSRMLCQYIQEHMSSVHRIRQMRCKVLEINYLDLLQQFQRSMRRIFTFLGLHNEYAVSSWRRLRNRSMHRRVLNWEALTTDKSLTGEMRAYLFADDCV